MMTDSITGGRQWVGKENGELKKDISSVSWTPNMLKRCLGEIVSPLEAEVICQGSNGLESSQP